MEVLDSLTASVMAHLWGLITEIPGGSDDDRIGLATAVVGEILARTLEGADTAPMIAEITNMRLAEHKLAWRLAPTQ